MMGISQYGFDYDIWSLGVIMLEMMGLWENTYPDYAVDNGVIRGQANQLFTAMLARIHMSIVWIPNVSPVNPGRNHIAVLPSSRYVKLMQACLKNHGKDRITVEDIIKTYVALR